jgi:DNA polymerase V
VDAETERSKKLMKALDQINGRWGRDAVRPASMGFVATSKMRQERLPPSFTSQFKDVPKLVA